jgi:hypothetical protein
MPRHSQLVSQMLENIDRKALEDYQHLIRRYIKGRNGVYAMYRGDKLYYVGLTTNLRNRLKAHLKDHHSESWDRFSVYLTIGTSFIKEMESLLMRIAQPPGNRQTGKFAKCQNLERIFRRDIRTEQHETMDEIFGRIRVQNRREGPDEKRRPVLANSVERAMTLLGKRKGQRVRARVRKNGTIRFEKRIFNSPSLAAVAAVGHPINGWGFWRYERAPGDWVKLRELRRK